MITIRGMAEEEKKKIILAHVNVRLSITLLLFRLILKDILITGIIISLYLLTSSSQYTLFGLGLLHYSFILFVLLNIFETTLSILLIVQWINEYYEISTYRVIHRKGIFFKKEERYSLQNIKQVKIEQDVLGKLLRYGTVTLYDWRLNKSAVLFNIHHPHKYLRILEDLLPNVDEQHSTIGDLPDGENEDE